MIKILKIVILCSALGALLGMAGAWATGAPFGWIFGMAYGSIAGLILCPLVIIKKDDPNIFQRITYVSIILIPVSIGISIHKDFLASVLVVALAAIALFMVWNKPKLFRVLAFLCLALSIASIGVKLSRTAEVPTKSSLIRDLGNDDMEISFSAGQALMKMGIDPFQEALESGGYSTRANAAHFIALMDDSNATKLLESLSDDKNPHVRMWVAFGFGRKASPNAKTILKKLSKDPEAFVREKAFEALRKN